MNNDDERKIVNEKIAFLVSQRIRELRHNPVDGAFDIAHLQEIHRRIFQDVPGIPNVALVVREDFTPGKFRSPVPEGLSWKKERPLKSTGESHYVYYSSMDTENVKKLEIILKDISVEQMSKLPEDKFKFEMAALYAKLDQIHPFNDGNSRTLREFTSQLAKETGYEIEWSKLDSESGHELLYIARDKSVNAITSAPLSLKDQATIRIGTPHFDKFPDLTGIIPQIIQKQESCKEVGLPQPTKNRKQSTQGRERDGR